MCARYTLAVPDAELQEHFELLIPPGLNPRFNVAPSQLVAVVGLKPDGTAHPGFVQSVRFTPDGSKLVTVGTAPKNKGYLAVWNVADGKPLAGYELAVGPIYSVDVTADGTAVLGCGPKVARGPTDSEAVMLPLGK